MLVTAFVGTLITPPAAVAAARCELAAAFLEDLRRIDAQIRDTRKKLAVAVQATGTSLTGRADHDRRPFAMDA